MCSKPICATGRIIALRIFFVSFFPSSGSQDPALIASISIALILLCVGAAVFFLNRLKKRTSEEPIQQGDANPVYGMYYFANGEHIDYGSAEVQDDNAYYGT